MLPRPHRRVRYLSGSLLRLGYRLSLALPKAMRVGTPIGRWATEVGEWAYVHNSKCSCHPCNAITNWQVRNNRIGEF
jgi:hypothetical protein